MTNSEDIQPFDADDLPAVVVRYLDAQGGDRRSAIDVFAPDARVTDEGIRYDGPDAIRGWLGTVATAYTYTTTLTGQQHVGEDRWIVIARLEGDFPGGVADLRYRFTVHGDRISELVIAP